MHSKFMRSLANLFYIIKHTVSLIHIACIVLYTYVEYWLFGDFNRFIDKVLQKLSKKNILYIKLVQACALNNDMCSNNTN